MSESPFDTTTTTDLTPGLLYDRDMEEALIGSVLINPDVFIDVAPILKPEDFF